MLTYDPDILSWLTYTHSLTDRLKQLSGEARLEVLSHITRFPLEWENEFLQDDSELLAREIIMHSGNTVCWYAKTLIPANTLKAKQSLFDRLQYVPLGELIHGNPAIERCSLSHFKINPDRVEYNWLPDWLSSQKEDFPARISCFKADKQHPFYLFEVFLPGLWSLI